MKTTILTFSIIGLLGLFGFITSNTREKAEEGIQFFTGTWQQALDKAKKENKPIFMDAFASWCGPCKMMRRKTFADKSVAEFYNKNFVNVAIDMEKGDGTALSEKYSVEAYPTLLFLKQDGKVIGKAMGFREPKEFLAIGKEAFTMK